MNTFLLLMQLIHLAIGLVEGVGQRRLDFVYAPGAPRRSPTLTRRLLTQRSFHFPIRPTASLVALGVKAQAYSRWFASVQPDGLEWSIARTTGHPELQATESALHASLSAVQKKLAYMDYKSTLMPNRVRQEVATRPGAGKVAKPVWPAVDAGTSPLTASLAARATLTLVMGLWLMPRRRKARAAGNSINTALRLRFA